MPGGVDLASLPRVLSEEVTWGTGLQSGAAVQARGGKGCHLSFSHSLCTGWEVV